MPILPAAKKDLRKSNRRRVVNEKRRRTLREQTKTMKRTIPENVKDAVALLPRVMQAIDKAAQKGIIKKNTASRKKSRIAAMMKKAGK
jgi:small subunit ribosomal protein S20